MSRLFSATAFSHQPLEGGYHRLVLKPDAESLPCEAGQFYMLQVDKGTDPLLKRPFSLFSQDNGLLHFLFRIVGRGTARLAELRAGETIELLGPLGRAFPRPEGEFIAIAGGSGIASIYNLMEQNMHRGHLFYGARGLSETVMFKEVRALSLSAYAATEDGSLGVNGTVIDALKSIYQETVNMPVYACGPNAMLKAVYDWTSEMGLDCYVSLEEHMACGIGACLSCVVKTRDGLKSVCKDGPVFKAEEVIWL